jgi:hypothetical protein
MRTEITSLETLLGFEELSFGGDSLPKGYATACDPLSQPNCTLIQTANSFYLFRVTIPAERRGVLAGGALGEGPVNARLVGALPGDNDPGDCASLTVGGRAVFLVERNGACKYVITSPIARLAHSPVRFQSELAMSH